MIPALLEGLALDVSVKLGKLIGVKLPHQKPQRSGHQDLIAYSNRHSC